MITIQSNLWKWNAFDDITFACNALHVSLLSSEHYTHNHCIFAINGRQMQMVFCACEALVVNWSVTGIPPPESLNSYISKQWQKYNVKKLIYMLVYSKNKINTFDTYNLSLLRQWANFIYANAYFTSRKMGQKYWWLMFHLHIIILIHIAYCDPNKPEKDPEDTRLQRQTHHLNCISALLNLSS